MCSCCKRSRRLVVLLSGLFLAALFTLGASAEDGAYGTVCVYPFPDDGLCVKSFERQGEQVLFLPADLPEDALCVDVKDGTLLADGTPVPQKEQTGLLAGAKELVYVSDAGETPVHLLRSANLPALFIETESGSMDAVHADKSHKEPATLSVLENGAVTLPGVRLKYIKGRGNSTWESQEKKPYNIKLEEKTDLFGMGAAKNWALLANAMDGTLMHNAAAFSLAQKMAFPYTVEYRYVDLYLNGQYAGNYLLTEKVETDGERVDIDDLEKENEAANPGLDLGSPEPVLLPGPETSEAGLEPGMRKYVPLPADPKDHTGGYLLECTFEGELTDARSIFLTRRHNAVLLKTPENASAAEINYIADLYQAAEDALVAPDGVNGEGKHYSDCIDLPSVLDAYLLREFTMERDGGIFSAFLFKRKGDDLLYAGPPWDFDVAMEDAADRTLLAARWYARAKFGLSLKTGTPFVWICTHEAFWRQAADRWALYANVVKGEYSREMRALRDRIAASAAMDLVRWAPADLTFDAAQGSFQAWYDGTDALFSFFSERADVLTNGFADPEAAVKAVKAEVLSPAGSAAGTWRIVCFAALIAGAGGILLYKYAKRGTSAAKKRKRNKRGR